MNRATPWTQSSSGKSILILSSTRVPYLIKTSYIQQLGNNQTNHTRNRRTCTKFIDISNIPIIIITTRQT